MNAALLGIHAGLQDGSRFHLARPDAPALHEWLTMLALGASAGTLACTLNLNLGLPGHAILRGILPLTLGLALVPRRLSGSLMGLTAILTALGFGSAGKGIGAAALTSLALTGPFLDLALWSARPGVWLYLRFALAGLLCNLAALGVRLLVGGGGRRMEASRPLGLISYPLFGLAAGLLCALLWFRFRARPAPPSSGSEAPP